MHSDLPIGLARSMNARRINLSTHRSFYESYFRRCALALVLSGRLRCSFSILGMSFLLLEHPYLVPAILRPIALSSSHTPIFSFPFSHTFLASLFHHLLPCSYLLLRHLPHPYTQSPSPYPHPLFSILECPSSLLALNVLVSLYLSSFIADHFFTSLSLSLTSHLTPSSSLTTSRHQPPITSYHQSPLVKTKKGGA
jgi:hypothetical protein